MHATVLHIPLLLGLMVYDKIAALTFPPKDCSA